eukprot:6475490-Alexandrium_andersonii.AAC.1
MLWNKKDPNTHFPMLSGKIKAATTRPLVPAVLSVWQEYEDAENPLRQDITAALFSLVEFYK